MMPVEKADENTTSDTGELRTFVTGATRDTAQGKLDWEGFISPQAMRYFAKYMHEHRLQSDGQLRDADNWQRGFSRKQIMKSLIRHVWDLWEAWRMEDANLVPLLCAVLFNTQAMLHEIALMRDVQE